MTEAPELAAQDDDNNPALSPEGDEPPHRRPRVWGRTSLKVKLVATLLLLSAIGLVVSSIAGSMQLHRYLYDRADDQLKKAAAQVALVVENSPPQAQLRLGDLPSQYKIRVFDTGGTVVRKTVEDAALVPDFGKVTIDEALSRNLRPFTQKSVNGKLGFRVIELPLDDGSGTVVLALPLKDIDDTLSHLLLINLVVGGGVLALLAFLGYAFVRSSLRPLVDVEVTAAAIAAGDLSRRVTPGDPRTEVGRLSGALNGMLSQIETAFRAQAASESQARASEERMRRFVADASHELRTPLTSIRGFAELYRQGAVAGQADVARVMRRVEEEAARMGLLVEDLLLLARLDQQRPLVQEPVDLLSIAADVVLDARARHPQRSIALIAGESPVPPVVLGDDARLRQVATNLVSNAILHTPPEASAAVSLQVEGDNAVLRVSDTGPGMPPAEAARVFERFYRADASR
ncbi:MAG: hypothetical protein QOG52_2489, partial [Frankiaceae bacterium]|nr:hypothetical protein [Frankiaceae bacterium]